MKNKLTLCSRLLTVVMIYVSHTEKTRSLSIKVTIIIRTFGGMGFRIQIQTDSLLNICSKIF